MPFQYGSFDITGCMRVLHHARRPELVVSELARVTRPGGTILVVDQLGFVDPVVSAETDRFEQARDPSHSGLLPDQDIRFLLDVNDLDVLTNEITPEQRDLERYLDLVGLEGDERRRVQRHGARRRLRGRDRLVRRAQARRRSPRRPLSGEAACALAVVRVVEPLQHPGGQRRQRRPARSAPSL